MFSGKPVIGVVGGIGSGKSFVARLFADEGCLVLSADEQVHAAYRTPAVKAVLWRWWGESVFDRGGEVSRGAVARIVFADPEELRRLEGLLHPIVGRMRAAAMTAAAGDGRVVAFVWDVPLLLEKELQAACDAVVFVDAPFEQRVERVRRTRHWDEAELLRREKSQLPLDKKRDIADYILRNTADAEFARSQLREILSRIIAGSSARPR